MKQLKQEGWVRSIPTSSKATPRKKIVVLFPINLNEKDIEVRPNYQKKTLDILSEIWDEKVS